MMLHTARRLARPVLSRCASTLILVEHDGTSVNAATLHTVTAAKKLGGPIHAIVAGDSCHTVSYFFYFISISTASGRIYLN